MNPPTTSSEMRNLCNTIIERRLGSQNPSTAIVSTALSLWEDPILVNALQNNPLFRNAKDRIERTAYHLLPSDQPPLVNSASEVFKEVFQCPVCGNNLKCSHDHAVECHSHSSSLPHEHSSDTIQFQEGTAGRVPEDLDSTSDASHASKLHDRPFRGIDLKFWFGPLVLASFAMVGLACKIFSGEISLRRFKSLSSRAFAAISILMQASKSVFGFLNFQPV